jgi:hypothetical protein
MRVRQAKGIAAVLEMMIIIVGLFGTGFVAGYSVRSYVSRRRRDKSRRPTPAHQS